MASSGICPQHPSSMRLLQIFAGLFDFSTFIRYEPRVMEDVGSVKRG